MTSHLFASAPAAWVKTAARRSQRRGRSRIFEAVTVGALSLVLHLASAATGNAAALICGTNPHPNSSGGKIVCYTFFGIKCNNKDLLQNAAWYYPNGWTCKDGLANPWGDPHENVTRAGDLRSDDRLIRDPSGRAMLVVDGIEYQIASDKFMAFMDELRRQTATSRASTAAIQDRVAAFLATDDGFVSEERMQQLSLELGLPIEMAAPPRPVEAPARRAPGR